MATFLKCFSFRKARTVPVVPPSTSADKTKTSAQNPPPEKRDDHYEPHTAQNALIFALETLSSVSRNIPGFGSVLSSVIDPLLAITARVEESSDNARGFIQLAARIRRIAGILEDTPNQGLIADLQRELNSITEDLEAARSPGALSQFFNSADNSSSLAKHSDRLTQIIVTATLAGGREALKVLKEIESKLEHGNEAPLDITGEVGGAGGSGLTGGQGDLGGGAQVEMDPRLKIRSICGGTGAAGGVG
ncbi:hypothetical protein B0H13DRAFT_2261989, partial [Mycena leptocephala]